MAGEESERRADRHVTEAELHELWVETGCTKLSVGHAYNGWITLPDGVVRNQEYDALTFLRDSGKLGLDAYKPAA